jgi:uncharacterized protein YecE (DUF72 family)
MSSVSDELSGRFYIGTSGYSYPGDAPRGWSGVFSPKGGNKRIDELEFYATYFDSVEINSTFYRPASPEMGRGWARKTPPEFVFAVKVWQKFTHPNKLGEGAARGGDKWPRFEKSDVALFANGIQPLADAGKLAAVLFQYPASFVCEPANVQRLQETLAAFNQYSNVVELRHRSWSDDAQWTGRLLERCGVTWAFIDEPKFRTSIKQELAARGDVVYLRLHGRNHEKWWTHQNAWERYDYFYSSESIRRLADRLTALARQSPQTKFYVFFNNHARGQAVANAFMLQAALHSGNGPQAPQSLGDAFPELRDFITEQNSTQVPPVRSLKNGE